MSERAKWSLRGRNPDILTCIASLSNDEVFTPPEFANRMLDTLAEAWAESNNGANIWADSSVTFLDPCTKSGVFLREITRRLTEGLAGEIPNLQERVDHILTKQVFGIAITRLTALMARRSLYCSKHAKGVHSVVRSFEHDSGNIWFERTEHTWVGTKCRYCDAPRSVLERDAKIENYAYDFIHTDDIRARLADLFGDNMQFDVVIGNPPYQMKGGAGGTSDSSIYHLFVQQALKLEPRYLSMVIPSRWLAGGRGMDEFRLQMLAGREVRNMVDFPVSRDVFPGVEVKGGVLYFLCVKDYDGPALVTHVRGEDVQGPQPRKLDEFDVFVRDSRAVSVLKKVLHKNESSMTEILTGDTPFGIATNFEDWFESPRHGYCELHVIRSGKRMIGYIPRDLVIKNVHLLDTWKVLIPKAGSDGGQKIPDMVLGNPLIAAPNSACTQSYLAFWVSSEEQAVSLKSYIQTRFFRFMVSLRKITQDALRGTYAWVPQQEWSQVWCDDDLFKKYDLSADDVAHIETVIKEMKSKTKDA